MNTRRKLVVAIGAGALATSFAIFSQQQSKVWRVGLLSQRHVDSIALDTYFSTFLQGMRELAYVQGKNLVIELRSAEGKSERLSDLAAELVKLKVDLVVVNSTPAVLAMKKTTSTIPIVMVGIADPVGNHFVTSLARPGGNITGLSIMIPDLGPKHLEMLLSLAPKLSRVAVLLNPSNPAPAAMLKNIQTAAKKVGVTIVPAEARSPQEIENAFAMIIRQSAGAIIVVQDPFSIQQRRQIAELAERHRLPSISGFREYAEAGGLMSYGANISDNYGRAATYVDKIFRGTKPGDLPVEQPTKFELVINGKTSKALGLTIPQSLLISADNVIE